MLGKGAFRAVSFSRSEPRRQNAVVLGGSNSKKGLLDCIAFSISPLVGPGINARVQQTFGGVGESL